MAEKTKSYWQWEKKTFILIGKFEAKENPYKKGVFMIPPRSTTIRPPRKKRGYTLVWHQFEEKWKNVKLS